MFIDSHAHLSADSTFSNASDMVNRALESGVEYIINICTAPEEVERGVLLSKQCKNVYIVASTTPHDAAKFGDLHFPAMENYAKNGSLVAIGETGLDYYYYRDTQEQQKNLLKKYLKLALQCNLPVVIHCRDAFNDFFEILDSDYMLDGNYGKGVLHCFTGTQEEASKVIERGFYLSFSGILTYPKSQELRDIAKTIPLERLLIETDTPYLAPQSKRGKSNEPMYIIETAAILAKTLGLSIEEIALATKTNAKRLFSL